MKAFPGYLADLVGVTVEDFTRVAPFEEVPSINFKGENVLEANDFNEILHLQSDDVEVMGTYSNAYFEGKPALVKRNYGLGCSYYFGGVFDLEHASLLLKEFELNNNQDQFELPEEIELAIRHKDGIEYTFLLNYSDRPQEIVVKKEFRNILTGNIVTNKHSLNPYDVLVLES